MTSFKTMYTSAFTKLMSQISQLPIQGFALKKKSFVAKLAYFNGMGLDRGD